MHVRATVPMDLFTDTLINLLDILVKGALTLHMQ